MMKQGTPWMPNRRAALSSEDEDEHGACPTLGQISPRELELSQTSTFTEEEAECDYDLKKGPNL